MKKRILALLLGVLMIVTVFAGCSSPSSSAASTPESSEPENSGPVEPKGRIILSTTTSTQDSGLLDYILPVFTAETGWEVDVVAVGTGAALQMGRDGEADVLLVHSKADELVFVEEKYGTARYDVMYNDYVIVGPSAGEITLNNDVEQTFKTIAENNLPFVSRGDDSGTNKKELAIWALLNIDPTTLTAYVNAGAGMGATLGMAAELNAYTLSDRATWLTFADKGDLIIVSEKSEDLLNYYGVIPVAQTPEGNINTEGGQAFADWMISDTTQALIASYGIQEFGDSLFTPNAGANADVDTDANSNA